MDTRPLGHTGLNVSILCLGTMTYGEQNSEAEGHEQMDYALDRGINFFDTSEIYTIPPRPQTQGSTERIIGSWFKTHGARHKVILATKVAGRAPVNWLRENKANAEQSRAQIIEAVDKSLKRLQTDYIDLYQLHWPDRPLSGFGGQGLTYQHQSGPEHPIESILQTLGDLVKLGKIRFIGLSNETSWGVMEFLHHAKISFAPRVQSIQNAYSLVNRTFELGLAEIAHREDVGLLAYSPLAQGYLTGKYQNGALPKGARKTLFDRLQRYERPEAQAAIARYLELAQKHALDPAQLAIRFCTTRPFVTSTIIGATNMTQLKTDIDALSLKWNETLEKDIDVAHHAQPNPAP
jgi:aryl-alcohol dehydrogenase-like predicted oxidoreductase